MASNLLCLTVSLLPSPSAYDHVNLSEISCNERTVKLILRHNVKQNLQLLTIAETMSAIFISLISLINLVKIAGARGYEYDTIRFILEFSALDLLQYLDL